MKRISLITMMTILMAIVLAGCGLQDVHKETPKETAPVVTMVKPKGIPVLMYHKIGEDVDNDAVIREDLFRAQMKFLKDNGYHPLTMEQLYAYVTKGEAVPEKPVVLTFDDGYADTYSIVYPLMKEYGFPATVFVNIDDMGTRLTWEEVKEMYNNGITIANHGYSHIEMGQLSQAEQVNNIRKGQEALERELGIKSPWFCYPYGDRNEFTEAAIKEAGVKMAMAMKPQGWAHEGDDPYHVLRVWVGNAVDLEHFEERISTEQFRDL